jgi:hypothetical protein
MLQIAPLLLGPRKEFLAEEEKQDGSEFWRGHESSVEKAEDR